MKKHPLLIVLFIKSILVSSLFAGLFLENIGSQYGLKKMLENPTAYRVYLGMNYGTYSVTDAYRTTNDTIAIKYAYKNGIVILNRYNINSNTFSGVYKTKGTVGSVTLNFNLDGTASGAWETIFIGGPLQILKK